MRSQKNGDGGERQQDQNAPQQDSSLHDVPLRAALDWNVITQICPSRSVRKHGLFQTHATAPTMADRILRDQLNACRIQRRDAAS